MVGTPLLESEYDPVRWPASPLAIAAGRGQVAVVNVLIRLGADATHAQGKTLGDSFDAPLFHCILGPEEWFRNDDKEAGLEGSGPEGGRCAIFLRMARLMENGWDENFRMPSRTAYRKVIRALCAAGASDRDTMKAGSKSMTALEFACSRQNYPAILELVLLNSCETNGPELLKDSLKKGKPFHPYAADTEAELADLDDPPTEDAARAVADRLIPSHRQLYLTALKEVRKGMYPRL